MKNHEETRDIILKAAIDEIAEHGFTHLRTQNIAKRAGVASGLLHYHFKTKENLLFEIIKIFKDSQFIDDIIIMPFSRVCNVTEKFQAIVYSLLEIPFLKKAENFNGFYHQMAAQGDDFIRSFLQEYDFFAENYVTHIIKQGIDEKKFSVSYPEYFTLTFYQSIINNCSSRKIFKGVEFENKFFIPPYPGSFKTYISESALKTVLTPQEYENLKPMPEDLKNIINMYIESISSRIAIITPHVMIKVLARLFNDGFKNTRSDAQ